MTDYSVSKEEMIEADEGFRRLHDEHQEYEKRLEALNHKSLRSPEDDIEEKRIKLHKLRLKDEMEVLLHASTAVEATA